LGMRPRALFVVFLLLLANAGACAVESPLAPRGKSKLAGRRCGPDPACTGSTSH
jgi:hypothetical protein